MQFRTLCAGRIFLGMSFILGACIIMFFQSCEDFEAKQDWETEVTNLGPLSQFVTYGLIDSSSWDNVRMSYHFESEELREDGKVCAAPVEWHQRMRLLRGRAQVCRYDHSLPPDTMVCMAIAKPYARLVAADGTEVFLKNSICADSMFSLCDWFDQQELEDLNSELIALRTSAQCQ